MVVKKWSKRIAIEHITTMKDPFEPGTIIPEIPQAHKDLLVELLNKAKEEAK